MRGATSTTTGGPISFGPYFSLDGVHPSTLAHTLVADSLVSAVNQTYGTSIPFPGANEPTLRQR